MAPSDSNPEEGITRRRKDRRARTAIITGRSTGGSVENDTRICV